MAITRCRRWGRGEDVGLDTACKVVGLASFFFFFLSFFFFLTLGEVISEKYTSDYGEAMWECD